jgi:hypothetical protein
MMANNVVAWEECGLCNCRHCGRDCLGERTWAKLKQLWTCYWPEQAKGMPHVAFRIDNKPYCSNCFPESNRPDPKGIGVSIYDDEPENTSTDGRRGQSDKRLENSLCFV